MDGYTARTYGDSLAGDYDQLWAAHQSIYGDCSLADETEGTLSFLTARTGAGERLLELGVGTGRLAIPLAREGRAVDGVDASRRMLDVLESKLAGEPVTAVHADMRQFSTGRSYRAAYVVFSTFFALPSQEDQLACMRTVSAHLEEGGLFVLDAFLPHGLLDRAVTPFDLSADSVWIDVAQHDPVEQRTRSHHLVLRSDGTFRLYPLVLRYAPPAELDLMARLAGLTLDARHADWNGTPLGPTSTRHVSVYRKA